MKSRHSSTPSKTRLLFGLCLSLAAVCMGSTDCVKTATGVQARRDGRVVWNLEIDTPEGRPFFHPLALPGGRVFTDLRPADHIWHLGYWFSWKFINGVNYWEPADAERRGTEPAGRTRVTRRDVRIDGAACTVTLDLAYGPRTGDQNVLNERRTISIGAPDADGGYAITTRHRFTALADVTLDRTPPHGDVASGKWGGGYAGMTLRANPETLKALKLSASGGGASPAAVTGRETVSVDFTDPATGEGYTFTQLAGPETSRFYLWPDARMANASVLYCGARALKRGETLELAYRLAVHARRPAPDFAEFRRELRAFYPDECHQQCKDPRQTNSVAAIGRALDAWTAAHPGYDALDVRREEYLAVRRHVQPFLFKTSPFYFELGCNGGWTHSSRTVPGRHVNRLCSRFYKEQNLIPDAAFALQRARQGLTLALCCGPFVDDMHHVPPFRTILRKGFKGVRDDVAAALAKCPKNDPLGRKELETALVGLDTIHAIQLKFAEEAKARLGRADLRVGRGRDGARPSPDERQYLERIAESAARCPWEPPRTFYEGLNTLWFVREVLGYLDGTDQFSLGRPDCYFIDLYRADLAAGRLTREEARELVARFLLTAELHHDGSIPVNAYNDHEMEIPMSLGGYDENGVWVYNELTEMFLDAHLRCGCVFPKMHCRISAKAPEAYLEKLGHLLMEGHAVFTLLNDDRYIPQYEREGFSPADARAYIGCGCWNGFIDSAMDLDEANYLSLIKVLEMTIHRDPEAMRRARLAFDPIDGAKSYEEVRETLYRNAIRFIRDIIGEYARYGRANAKVFPHPVYTMCLKGGIESRRDTTDAGIPPNARPKVMTLGFIGNVVDCLSSINRLCFVDKVCTLDELLAAVRSNWKGPRGEELRLRAMAAPSWGDNSPETNAEMAWWMNRISRDVEGMRSDQGGPIKFAIYTYREFMYWGLKTKATPDGRRDGDRLAQGFSPSEYRCKSDVTTVINAIGSFPHDLLYASNANLTFDRSAMNEKLLAAILRVYCEKGAHMIQPNCNSVEELLDAQKHPERHQNLIVRVCGFSARFVALSKRWQDEVIARHRLK